MAKCTLVAAGAVSVEPHADTMATRRPRALELPPGRGPELRDAMADAVTDLRRAVPQAMESEHVSDQRASIVEKHGGRAGDIMDSTAIRELLTQASGAYDVVVIDTPPVLAAADAAHVAAHPAADVAFVVDAKQRSRRVKRAPRAK